MSKKVHPFDEREEEDQDQDAEDVESFGDAYAEDEEDAHGVEAANDILQVDEDEDDDVDVYGVRRRGDGFGVGGFLQNRALIPGVVGTDHDTDDDVAFFNNGSTENEGQLISLGEDDESGEDDDIRFNTQDDGPVGFSSFGVRSAAALEEALDVEGKAGAGPRPRGQAQGGIAEEMKNKKNKKNSKNNKKQQQEEEEEEVVEFAGVDDDAAAVVGLSQGAGASGPGGAASGFISAEMESKVTQLASVVHQYKSKNRSLRQRQAQVQEENEELREQLARMEEEKEDAELKAERDLRMLQFKNMGPAGGAGGGGRNLASDLEAQRKREEARRKMYATADQGDDYEVKLGLESFPTSLGFAAKVYTRASLFVRKNYPLNRDLRRIDARFGSSVAAYFHFYRWMITNYMAMSVVCAVYLFRHVWSLVLFQDLSAADKESRYNSAQEPMAYFDWRSSDWARLSSFLPKFLMFSSFNPGDSGAIYVASNLVAGTPMYHADGSVATPAPYEGGAEAGERMDYVGMLIICHAVLLTSAVLKWMREDRKAKAFGLFEEVDKQNQFAQVSLSAWDHSLQEPREVEDHKHSLLDQYFLMAHELETANLAKSRTINERLNLYARRVVSNFLYLAIQGSSAWAIVYLTATSSQLSQQLLQAVNESPSLQWLLPVVSLLAGSIVPLAVSIMNALLPAVAMALTSFEKWDDAGLHTKLMLFRLFVAKILNALIQIFSFLQLLDPYLMRGTVVFGDSIDRTTRTNTEKRLASVGSSYGQDAAAVVDSLGNATAEALLAAAEAVPRGLDECRADMYGAGIFQLVLTEFIISKLAFFAAPALVFVFAKMRSKPHERKEFHVAKHTVDLLYFQQLCFVSFPFFPFGTFIILGMMLAGFKTQMRVLSGFMAKPKKPWSAKDAANFFIKFFFFTLVVSIAIACFLLSNQGFPKACTLQEHITRASFNDTDAHPLRQCFDADPTDPDNVETCFINDRTVAQIKAGTDHSPGLEELRFWEEFYVAKLDEADSDATLPTEALLRDTFGYPDETAVSYPSLLVCSMSCGPFVYAVNFYAPLDNYLSDNLKTIYTLATQSPLFVWALTVILMLRFVFTKNTIGVLQELQQEKEIALSNIVANLESRIRKLTSKIDKLKQQ